MWLAAGPKANSRIGQAGRGNWNTCTLTWDRSIPWASFPGVGSTLIPGEGGTYCFTLPFTGIIATHTHFTDNIVQVGLNYKFSNYYVPVATK